MTKLFKFLAVLFFFINLGDAVSTHLVLDAGFAEESNPLMAWAWDTSPLLFMASKLTLGYFVTILLYRRAHTLLGRLTTVLALLMYSFVVAAHVRVWTLFWPELA